MKHNPETYGLTDARRFLRQGLRNLLEFAVENKVPKRSYFGQLRCAVADLEYVVSPWPDKKTLYSSELGYLAIREREQELFSAFATLFSEIIHSTGRGRRPRLQLIRHPQFEELRLLGKDLLNLMEPDEIDQLESSPVTAFVAEAKVDSEDRTEKYYGILRAVFELYDPDRYPIWHPETKRNWFDSDDEPFTPAEFEDWLFQSGGHEWFYGRYAFSKDESHSVYMDGDNLDTFMTFTVANEDVPKAREMISKIDGLYQIITEYQPGSSEEIAHVYGKPFIKLQQPHFLVADRFALREALVRLTDSKFNEWWKSETCFLKLEETIEWLARLCLSWDERRDDFLSEFGHLAIKPDEFEEFEQLAVLYEQIRKSCSRKERFEFEFVKDPRWEQLVEIGRNLLPKVDIRSSPGFKENTTSFTIYAKPMEPDSLLPREVNFFLILQKVVRLYNSTDYPYWCYLCPVYPEATSFEKFIVRESGYVTDHVSYADDESHSVFVRADEADLEIEFSLENSQLHLANKLIESIDGLFSIFQYINTSGELVTLTT